MWWKRNQHWSWKILSETVRENKKKKNTKKRKKKNKTKKPEKFEDSEIPEMVRKIPLLKMKANESTALNEQHIV